MTPNEQYGGSFCYVAQLYAVVPLPDGRFMVYKTSARHSPVELSAEELPAFFAEAFAQEQANMAARAAKEAARKAADPLEFSADALATLDFTL